MTKENKVPVQKGSINPNPMKSKQMTRQEKVSERLSEYGLLKRNQTLDLHMPKQ